MATIEIPDPSLVVLIGAAGAGKTTFAARHFEADRVLSSDAFRAILSGDEADQSLTRAAFAMLHRELDRRLASGLLTVVDATSVQIHARRALTARAQRHAVPAIAIVLDLPDEVVHDRNRTRPGRSVDAAVVSAQIAALRAALLAGPVPGEGFALVIVLRTPDEVEGVRLRPVTARR